ncbi:DUF397 domain-containing protein [Spirillospora sp. NPDC029432]
MEVARLDNAIGVRDSKNPDAGHITLSAGAFARLVHHAKQDRLNF